MSRRPAKPSPGPRRAPEGSRATAAILGVAVLGFAFAHAWYLRFLCDDAFISFRYASNLERGLGLVYNAGERVEGYSNFLWTVLMAAVLRAGGRPETWSQALGIACALGTVTAVAAFARRRGHDPAIAGVLVASGSAFAAWATGGLETSLFTLCVTGGTLALAVALAPGPDAGPAGASARWLRVSALALGLAALTRPDGWLVAACAGAVVALEAARRRLPAAAAAAWAGIVAALVAPHVLWRLSYYGRLLPNSFDIKSPGPERLAGGLRYLADGVVELHLWLLLLPVAVVPFLRRDRTATGRADGAVIAAIVLPFLAYVATTGGDFMPLHRFLAPVIPLVAVAAAAALSRFAAPAGAGARALAVLVVVAYGALNLHLSWRHQSVWASGDRTSIGWARQDTRDWLRLGDLLGRVTLATDTLATTAAGAVPYRSGLPTVDLLGLNAADLSRYRRRDTDRPGHTLLLDERWLEGNPPPILLGHPLVKPTPRGVGLSLDLREDWRARVVAHYQLVGLRLPGEPERYVGCMLRNDVADRVIAAGAALDRGGR